mgnify:CR=1 FL=1
MTGAELRCHEGPALDDGDMNLTGGFSDPDAADGIQRGSRLVEAAIAAISSEEIVRCKLGPVWGGAVATPPKTQSPRRTLGNGKFAGIPTRGFISFHDLSRPGEGCGNP